MSSPYSMPLQWPFAANLYGFNNGPFGYLIPKPKFLFYVQFIIRASYQLPPSDWPRLGYIVKNVDRPKLQYKIQELDQYNRKRVAYTKIDYPSISLTMYDTVDGSAAQLIDDYNRHNFGDFSNMTTGDGPDTHNQFWTNDSITGNDMTYWGYRVKNPSNYLISDPVNRGLPTAEYFFDEVRIYEFYGNNFTMYSLMNPKIESVNFDATDVSSSDPQEVTMVLNPEGVLFNYINAPVNYSQIATSIMPGPGFTTNNFPISGLNTTQYLLGLVGSVAGGLLSNLTNGIFGSYGSLNLSSGENNAIGIIGGVGITAAASSILGPTSSTIVGASFAQGYTQTAALQQNSVLNPNTAGIQTVSGIGSGSISLGSANVGNIGSLGAINSVNSLF
jgi:hypothetical protein